MLLEHWNRALTSNYRVGFFNRLSGDLLAISKSKPYTLFHIPFKGGAREIGCFGNRITEPIDEATRLMRDNPDGIFIG
jgi:hypothetical protein